MLMENLHFGMMDNLMDGHQTTHLHLQNKKPPSWAASTCSLFHLRTLEIPKFHFWLIVWYQLMEIKEQTIRSAAETNQSLTLHDCILNAQPAWLGLIEWTRGLKLSRLEATDSCGLSMEKRRQAGYFKGHGGWETLARVSNRAEFLLCYDTKRVPVLIFKPLILRNVLNRHIRHYFVPVWCYYSSALSSCETTHSRR